MNKVEDGSGHQPQDSQEIDLFDLIIQLWRGKGIIALCMALSLACGGGYLLVTQARWVSIATVTLPDSGQITAYQNAVSALYSMMPQSISELESQAFNRFSTAFSALTQTLDNQYRPEKLTLEPKVKNQPYPLQLSYQASTALAAQSQLAAYIERVNQGAARELIRDLTHSITLQIDNLQRGISTQEKIAQEQKDLHIRQIREALKFAEAAGLPRPQVRQADNVNQDTLFLLGSEALRAMIARESSRPLALSQNYYQLRQQLLDLQSLHLDAEAIDTFRYVLSPTLPHTQAGPKRALVIVLTIVLGAMLGCGIVLARNAYRLWRRQQSIAPNASYVP